MTDEAKKEKMTIIMFSGELDKALAGFTLANTAASMGMDVSMFFTFWGLNIVKKNKTKSSGKGFIQKMFGVLNKGGTSRLPLSRFHMLGLGTSMMKKVMRKTRIASIDEMMELAKSLGVKLMACTMSMGVMGVNADNLRPEVDSLCGAATYLAEARKSAVNLFI
jgi:peroxiredoxin family protein